MSRLYDILKELNRAERRTLLWTNPNPTSAFASQSITFEQNYDAYDIVFTGYVSQESIKLTTRMDESASYLTHITGGTGGESGILFIFKRNVWRVTNGVGVGNVSSSSSGGSWSPYTANTGCVPYKIYGIKYAK